MIKKLNNKISLLLLLGVLAGCSVVDERKEAYKNAELLQPLEVPPDLLSIEINDDLSAPTGATVTLSEFNKAEAAAEKLTEKAATDETLVVPHVEVGLALNEREVSIVRDGNYYWLVLPGQPDQWWSHVKRFWQSREVAIELEVPKLGLLQTEWLEDKRKLPEVSFFDKAFSKLRSSNLRDQYVVRLEPTIAGDGTEIHIVHRGLTHETYGENLRWIPRARDKELEIEAIKRLALYIGVGEEQAEILLAASEKTQKSAVIENLDDGSLNLKLNMGFAQAWREVGDQVIAKGMEVEDIDRSLGVYYVRGNLLSNLSKADVFARFNSKQRGEVKAFMVKLEESASAVNVNVLGREGSELTAEEIEYFLITMKDELN